MTLNKLTNDIQPLSEVDKINEIIDSVNSISIPSVGNGIVSFTQNGQQKGSFAANQSSNTTIDFDLSSRNIGEIVASTIPLTDAGLHLLDGALIQGDGIYKGFVDYIAELYDETSVSGYKSNVTKVGSLSDNNGVLSGFSTSNYATIKAPSSSINSFELVLKVKTASDITTYQVVLGQTQTNIHTPQINVPSDNSGIIRFSFPLGTNSWSNIDTSFSIQANTEYWLKMVYDGSNNIAYYSTDGQSYIQVGSVSNSNGIQWDEIASLGLDLRLNPFLGSIDLKESYIDINGQRWWTGAEEIKPCFCTESQWQDSVTQYGVCGKFVYDSVNNTVRLPKYSNKIYTQELDTTAPIVGNGLTLGLTNGSTNYGLANRNFSSGEGSRVAASVDGYGITVGSSSGSTYNASNNKTLGVTTVATNSGLIAQLSNITTSLDGYYYIVIATSTKTDVQVDIDEIATDLNGKADIDLTNTTNQAKILMSGMGMPGDRYVDLTLGANNSTYTAPANGWVLFTGRGSGYVSLTQDFITIYNAFNVTSNYYSVLLPVKKGIFTANYTGITKVSFRFIYAIGSESEVS